MPTHIEYRTRGPRWNGTPYLSLASAQHELTALLPGRYRIEQRTVTTTEWQPLAAADREKPDADMQAAMDRADEELRAELDAPLVSDDPVPDPETNT